MLNGLAPLSGPTQTLPALYGIPASDYHDITVGYNFYNAGPGYDLVTGRGSPIAQQADPRPGRLRRRHAGGHRLPAPVDRAVPAASSARWSRP